MIARLAPDCAFNLERSRSAPRQTPTCLRRKATGHAEAPRFLGLVNARTQPFH